MQQTERDELRRRIDAAIIQAYSDLRVPQFHFVAEALSRFPYGMLAIDLEIAGWSVVETTDVNDDVAWHFGVTLDDKASDLAIAMAGPFARFAGQHAFAAQAALAPVLMAHGLTLIPAGMLQEKTALILNGAPATIADALFACA